MGSDSDSSRSRDRHKDKAKKQKKIKKQKKEKKDKKQKKEKKEKKEKHHRDKSYSRQKDKRDRVDQRERQTQKRMQKYQQRAIQKVYVPRTHIPCRRCQEQTFSLKIKQCTNCGYPKEQRPANFPVMKEIDVMEMIREGKMIHNSFAPVVIEIVVNDRMGRKQRIKCHPDELIIDFKRLIAAQIGTRAEKIRLQKASIIFKDHLTLSDYEIKDGAGLEMYYD